VDDKHYQACFSSLDHSGLRVFNASPDLPPEACASFARLQGSNLEPPAPAGGQALRQPVAELAIDDAYVYNSRISYDAQDTFGRRCLFTHSFIFPIEAFLDSPERVLLLDESNFMFTQEGSRPGASPPLMMDPHAPPENVLRGLKKFNRWVEVKRRLEKNECVKVAGAACVDEVKYFMYLLLQIVQDPQARRGCSFTTGASPSAKPKGIHFSLK